MSDVERSRLVRALIRAVSFLVALTVAVYGITALAAPPASAVETPLVPPGLRRINDVPGYPGFSTPPRIAVSATGRFVAFSTSTNEFVLDRQASGAGPFDTPLNTHVTPISLGGYGSSSYTTFTPFDSAITASGASVFWAEYDGGPDYSYAQNVYTSPRTGGQPATLAPGQAGLGTVDQPAVSADGTIASYHASQGVGPGGLAAFVDAVYQVDTATGARTLVSHDPNGNLPSLGCSAIYCSSPVHSSNPSMSGSGRFTTFEQSTSAGNLQIPPAVYRYDSAGPVASNVQQTSVYFPGNGVPGSNAQATISDGEAVTFTNANLGTQRVLVKQMPPTSSTAADGQIEYIEPTHAAGDPVWDSRYSTISADGNRVAFNMIGQVESCKQGISVYDRSQNVQSTIAQVQVTEGGCAHFSTPVLSANGKQVVFWSDAGLTPGDNDGQWDLYAIDLTDAAPFILRNPEDLYGNSCRYSHGACASDPVNTAIGNLTESAADLTSPASVFGLTWDRSYNSRDTKTGALGKGWSVGYASKIVVLSDARVGLYDRDGRLFTFTPNAGGAYDRPDTYYGNLTQRAAGGWDAAYFDGHTDHFTSTGQLSAQTSWDGQTVTLGYGSNSALTSVTSSTGRSLTIAHRPDGLISSVSADDGRTVQYGYTADGNLHTVTDPAGAVWTYTVDADGLLISTADPLSVRLG